MLFGRYTFGPQGETRQQQPREGSKRLVDTYAPRKLLRRNEFREWITFRVSHISHATPHFQLAPKRIPPGGLDGLVTQTERVGNWRECTAPLPCPFSFLRSRTNYARGPPPPPCPPPPRTWLSRRGAGVGRYPGDRGSRGTVSVKSCRGSYIVCGPGTRIAVLAGSRYCVWTGKTTPLQSVSC